jgi:lipoate-protein ligase A
VGAFQDTWSEVDVDYCRANGIDIVRRANGGGAVYHDIGSFCFSAFFPRAAFTEGEEELCRLFAGPVIRTCADYGVAAHFAGRNDVLARGRKIYGSAHLAWYDVWVQSGTFLVNIDFEVMGRALTPPAAKFVDKPVSSIHERVTSLAREMGREADAAAVMECFTSNLCDMLGISLTPGGLAPEEQALASELLAVKYGTDEWNLGAQLKHAVTVAARTKGGVVSLSVSLQAGRIRQVRVQGDLLVGNRVELGRMEQALVGRSPEGGQLLVDASPLPADVRRALVGLLEEVAQQKNCEPAGIESESSGRKEHECESET